MEEDKKEGLVEYISKLQQMADFLAKGGIIESKDGIREIAFSKDELVEDINSFSICQYNHFNILEESYYGEQKSIGILIKYLEEGYLQRQSEDEEKIDYYETEELYKEGEKFYNRTMKKVNSKLKKMVLYLINGLKIPCSININDTYESQEGDNFLFYNIIEDCFYVINKIGETVFKIPDISQAMQIVNDFFIEKEEWEMCIKNAQQFEEQIILPNEEDIEEFEDEERE